MTITSSPTGVGGTLTVNAVNGVAKFNNLVCNTALSYTLTASSPGLTAANSNAISIVAGPANKLVFTVQPPVSAAVNAVFGTAVQVQDAVGNLVAGSIAAITMASSPAGLSGTLTVNAVSGVATFGNLEFNTAGSYTLAAFSSGLVGAGSQAITVTGGAAAQTISFTAPVNVVFGMAPFALNATATSGLPVTFVSTTPLVCSVSGTMLAVVTAGNCSVTANQAGNSAYLPATPRTQSFAVVKAIPIVTWPTPAPVMPGTPLGPAQLDATANVPGTFVYLPPAGEVPPATHAIGVTFTPTDTNDYTVVTAQTTITVISPANVALASKYLVRVGSFIEVELTIKNSGGTAARNVTLTGFTLGTASGAPVPQNMGTLAPGASASVVVKVPGTVGPSQAVLTMAFAGTYDGGTFSGTGNQIIP